MKVFFLSPAWLLLALSTFAEAGPITTPNLSPPVVIHGGPAWTIAPESDHRLSWELTGAAANHFSLDQSNNDRVRLDGETRYLHFGLRWQALDRWIVGIDIPWIQHTDGELDSFIDSWHDFFGLPDGGRDSRARDQLEFSYLNGGDVVFNLTEATSGLGDIRVGAGRILGESANWLLWAELKIPSGEISRLTGSGGSDVAVSLTHRGRTERWQRPLNWYWGASVSHLGETELRAAESKSVVARAMGGLTYQLFEGVAFKTQLELASPHYAGTLEPLADPSLQLALGAEVRLGQASLLDLIIVEDLSVNASPDVTFIINFRFSK